ncbi:hypothetical protein EMCRGX_G011931 [Ephydatia muelleri]
MPTNAEENGYKDLGQLVIEITQQYPQDCSSKYQVASAISLAQDGLYGKTCQALVSIGVAPNSEETWKLLLSKHPKCEQPTTPAAPEFDTSILSNVNIMAILRSFPKLTVAGPTVLRVQHLIDAAETPFQTAILSSLKAVVHLLASGKAPSQLSVFLAGGNLTALNKSKPDCPLDVRPIAVGETLRRLTGKCLCAAVKCKAAEFFQPHQFGVACPFGTEKIAHGLRGCIEEHWSDPEFAVLKVDLKNAFNMVSRQALLVEVKNHFPELLPWACWCYGLHPLLWHTMALLQSESGVQQGDPLGPLFFDLVLNLLISEISEDESHNPNIEILGIPISDKDFCSAFISRKRSEQDPCLKDLRNGFCRLAHLARATPPSLAMTSLQLFDEDVRRSFSLCTAVDTTDVAWQQAQLSLSRGGLGMRSLSLHSPAAFIASLCFSGYGSPSNHHLSDAIQTFNESVSPSDAIQSDGLVSSTVHQNQLSSKIDIHQFNNILIISSVADKARLLSVSSPHAASWLTVVPSEGLGLHLEPSVFQVAVKWWLGLDTSNGSLCALCPNNALDPLGHLATTCNKGGDVVTRHNQLRNVLAETCRRAHLSVKVEMGSNLTSEHDHSRPADILLPNWALGKPAAFDIPVTSPLNPKIVSVAGLSAGAAALSTEERKHTENDPKCNALGWCCVPLVTESYDAWGKENHGLV